MNEELQQELQWCCGVANKAREVLATLPAKVVIERAREWCEGAYLIELYSKQAETADAELLAQLTLRAGTIAGAINYQILECTQRLSKKRGNRNRQLAHQAKRLQTAKRYDVLRQELNNAQALRKLAVELDLSETTSVEKQLACKLSPKQQQQLEEMLAQPWFTEFLEHMDRCIPELLSEKGKNKKSKKS